eukprot:RCo005029
MAGEPPRKCPRGGKASDRNVLSFSSSSSEDSDDEGEGAERPSATALPAPRGLCTGEASGPPSTAEEYLARVRAEARRCPQTLSAAHIDPKKDYHKRTLGIPKIILTPLLPASLVPEPTWRRQLLAGFARFRTRLDSLHQLQVPSGEWFPGVHQLAEWKEYCFPPKGKKGPRPRPPSTGVVLRMDHVLVTWLLARHIAWARGDDHSVPLGPPYHNPTGLMEGLLLAEEHQQCREGEKTSPSEEAERRKVRRKIRTMQKSPPGS